MLQGIATSNKEKTHTKTLREEYLEDVVADRERHQREVYNWELSEHVRFVADGPSFVPT